MKWPPLLLFLGWLAIFPSEMLAEEPDGPLKTLSSPKPESSCLPKPSLLRQNQAAHFYLVLGRLQLDPVRYRKGSQSLIHEALSAHAVASQSHSGDPVTESIHIDCNRGIPSMHYTMSTATARLTIDADSRGPWRIESNRMAATGNVRVVVQQTPGSPIVLRCLSDAPELTIRAATWLHLREADRATFVEHLEPIIDELLWPYQFNQLADDAKAHSLRQIEATTIDDESISHWIDDLRSPSRSQRTIAERQLQSVGIALLPRLNKLDWPSLEAEQRHRLRTIQSTLTPLAEDDSVRLANLIHRDVDYWQLASERLDDREQQIIALRFKPQSSQLPRDRSDQAPRIASGPVSRGR